jgi:predicted lactoylglutathione lyase
LAHRPASFQGNGNHNGNDWEKKMTTKIFVNLAVKDLDRSKAFFAKLGYKFNPQFTDATAASMVISEDIYAMLLTEAKFKEFTRKEIADASKTTEVLTRLSADSRAKVDGIVDIALKSGATEAGEPMDHGFMYSRSFNDLDGHIWEYMWMDPAAINKEP